MSTCSTGCIWSNFYILHSTTVDFFLLISLKISQKIEINILTFGAIHTYITMVIENTLEVGGLVDVFVFSVWHQ